MYIIAYRQGDKFMLLYTNLDRADWETFKGFLGMNFEAAVRSGSASQLMKALDETVVDSPGRAFIVKQLWDRVARFGGRLVYDAEQRSFDSYSPKITPAEYSDALALIVKLAGPAEGIDGAVVRLAALDALGETVKRGGHIGDGAIDAVVEGLSCDTIIARRCAGIIEDMAEGWPYQGMEERKARLEDKAVPALQRAASRLSDDKCAHGSMLDALDTLGGIVEQGDLKGEGLTPDYRRDSKVAEGIGRVKKVDGRMFDALERVEYGAGQLESLPRGRSHEEDTSYRMYLGDGKTLRAPVLRAKLETAPNGRGMARLIA